MNAILVLENGEVFEGDAYGAPGVTIGELVFATGMTGYQETITDPSYAGQIVVQTAPHIGIVGVNERDEESSKIWVAGYVVREPSRMASNFRAERTLESDLQQQGIVGISGLDTRALTLVIRNSGAMRAGIFSGVEMTKEEMISKVKAAPEMKGMSLSNVVTTDKPYTLAAKGNRIGSVAILDLGIKKSTLEHLNERGLDVLVYPANVSKEVFLGESPSGVFFSNGPGDPEASGAQVELLREVLDRKIPFFGICFGNQLLGRALGFETYKLAFGHRGINQPVMHKETGRVEVTAHNHGFAVKLDDDEAQSPNGYGRVKVSHRGLNDNVVEGLECMDIPAFSVQYHPEAAAGPHDSHYLFDKFISKIEGN
ncbi:MAG: glutamine-hydrolyzing carbamoyl-phosphate synthase small subunit [Actinomycetota bacterium]|jgi:carbamoyl-phosphate synthase small subunit